MRFDFAGNRPPDGCKEVHCGQINSFARRQKSADSAGFTSQQREKPVLAGTADSQAVKSYPAGAGLAKQMLGAKDLPIRQNQDVPRPAVEQLQGGSEGLCQLGAAARVKQVDKFARLVATALVALVQTWSEFHEFIVKGDDAEFILFHERAQARCQRFLGLFDGRASHRT